MSDKTDKTTPDLQQAFSTVVEWLQFDMPLNEYEMASLKLSFELAAQQNDIMFVASSRTNTVVVSDGKAVSIKVTPGLQDWFRGIGKGKIGECFDRDGFFLFNVIGDENNHDKVQREMAVGWLYDAATPDKKMKLG